jgi:hypothetical protein
MAVVAGHVEATIQRRLCKYSLLLLESRCVQAASLIKAHDEVDAPAHAGRLAVGELNEDLGHPHALANQSRQGVVLRIAQQPLEDGASQYDKLAVVVNDEPAASDAHRFLFRPQRAASGRSLGSQSVPCQFEMRPSAWQRGQCQTMALSVSLQAVIFVPSIGTTDPFNVSPQACELPGQPKRATLARQPCCTDVAKMT